MAAKNSLLKMISYLKIFFISETMSMFVEVYSEKAIVLRGAQEHHRSILEANKGMFNPRLKGGAGWIFPKFMKGQVEALIEQINSGVDIAPPPQKAAAVESEVSKKEYLALVSRVERLEALVTQLLNGSGAHSSTKAAQPASSSTTPPSLEEIPMEELELDFEDEEEVPIKKLSKPKTLEQVKTTTARKSFSKPKVNL
jgi:hypothetical protein